MRELQREIIAQLGVRPEIDPAAEAQRRIRFLIDYLRISHAKGFVLGISGGVDSTLAGRLCQLAVEQARLEGTESRFVAIRLPHNVQADEADAQAALGFIRPDETYTFNIGEATAALSKEFQRATSTEITDFTRGNMKARLRMIAQFAIAGDAGMLVVGTDHAAEAVTGFYTKFGDGAADLTPLSGLNKRQVRAICAELGAPESLWGKVPTADLLDARPGRTDEDELGLSYDQIDDYLERREVPEPVADLIEEYFLRSRHKRHLPPTPTDTWWR